MDVYANWLLPIYCMFTARETDIANKTVVITKRMIEEFRWADGWIGIVRYDFFERLLNWKIDSGNGISLRSWRQRLGNGTHTAVPRFRPLTTKGHRANDDPGVRAQYRQ